MRTLTSSLRLVMALAVMGTWISGCAKPAPPTEAPPSEPASEPATAPAPAPTESEPPADSPREPDAATTTAMLAMEPALDTMQIARPANAKIGVPVDLRYSFDSPALPGQPVQLHLAAVPRVAGGNLRISVQQDPGLELSEATLNVQKAAAAGAYRKQLALTRQAGGPAVVRVLITMGVEGGSFHGYYHVPLEPGAATRKQDSVKPR